MNEADKMLWGNEACPTVTNLCSALNSDSNSRSPFQVHSTFVPRKGHGLLRQRASSHPWTSSLSGHHLGASSSSRPGTPTTPQADGRRGTGQKLGTWVTSLSPHIWCIWVWRARCTCSPLPWPSSEEKDDADGSADLGGAEQYPHQRYSAPK
jgi:hypothetical protein